MSEMWTTDWSISVKDSFSGIPALIYWELTFFVYSPESRDDQSLVMLWLNSFLLLILYFWDIGKLPQPMQAFEQQCCIASQAKYFGDVGP
jgi:hypothetical protein